MIFFNYNVLGTFGPAWLWFRFRTFSIPKMLNKIRNSPNNRQGKNVFDRFPSKPRKVSAKPRCFLERERARQELPLGIINCLGLNCVNCPKILVPLLRNTNSACLPRATYATWRANPSKFPVSQIARGQGKGWGMKCFAVEGGENWSWSWSWGSKKMQVFKCRAVELVVCWGLISDGVGI